MSVKVVTEVIIISFIGNYKNKTFELIVNTLYIRQYGKTGWAAVTIKILMKFCLFNGTLPTTTLQRYNEY